MIQNIDPITAIENMHWFIFESHPGLTTRVRPGNRIKLTGGLPIHKDSALTADLPEVQLIPISSPGHEKRTSSGEGLRLFHQWRVQTSFEQTQGDGRQVIQTGINPIVMEFVRAYGHWQDTFPTLPWVKQIRLEPIDPAQTGDESGRVTGWATVLTVNTLAYWPDAEFPRWA